MTHPGSYLTPALNCSKLIKLWTNNKKKTYTHLILQSSRPDPTGQSYITNVYAYNYKS